MAIIYETINLYNKMNGINPWRYIGSDQKNNSSYFGSSKKLKEDISKLGSDYFVKVILEDLGDIENKKLREIEANKYLKPNNVKSDETYYNKSEIYGPGGSVPKGYKHKKPRSKEHIDKIVEFRTGTHHGEDAKKKMREKKTGTKASESTKQKMSEQRLGDGNPNALSWFITSPEGKTFNITGLRKWARDNDYNYFDIYDSKNGWTAVKHGAGKGGGRKKNGEQNEG
jgi:hypothetical protein